MIFQNNASIGSAKCMNRNFAVQKGRFQKYHAVPLFLYHFIVLHCRQNELHELYISNQSHSRWCFHPRSWVPQIFLPRHHGGRGLLSLEYQHYKLFLRFTCKLVNSLDPLLEDYEIPNVEVFHFRILTSYIHGRPTINNRLKNYS